MKQMKQIKPVKRILLFLSDLKPNANEALYTCPDGEVFIGTQTNEAPVQYLLHCDSDVGQVLCIVTEEARRTAWEKFQATVKELSPEVEVVDIPFREGEDIARGPLMDIQARVRKDDELLLDITGGPRNAVLDLLLLSRALSYSGARTTRAVYTDFQGKKIVDISRSVGFFDLVAGMQELASCGSVRSLRAYYGKTPKDPAIGQLITAMEGLSESITMCRTTQLDERMAEFNAAMDAVEDTDDPMLQALLPGFRKKFDRRMSTPGVIKWCVENGMIQQALTLYKERVPVVLFRDAGLLEVKETASPLDPEKAKDFSTEEEARFFLQFLPMGQNLTTVRYGWQGNMKDGKWKNPYVTTLGALGDYLADPKCYFRCRCTVSQMEQISRDYLYLRMVRNLVCHASEEFGEAQEELRQYLCQEYHYPDPARATSAQVQDQIVKALDLLRIAQEQKGRK